MMSHVSPRLTIRLPRIGHHLDQTSRSKKLALKMSHQSLEFSHNLQDRKDHKARYGAMNGSFLHIHTEKERKGRKD